MVSPSLTTASSAQAGLIAKNVRNTNKKRIKNNRTCGKQIYRGLYCTIFAARQPVICRAGDFFRNKIFQRKDQSMVSIDPLTAAAVVLATAATDAVYVMFTSAVVARKRVPAASW